MKRKFLFLFFLFFTSCTTLPPAPQFSYADYQAEIILRVNYENLGRTNDISTYIPLPQDSETQKIIKLKFTPSPQKIISYQGQGFAYFNFPKEQPQARIEMKLYARLRAKDYNFNEDTAGKLTEIDKEKFKEYLKDSSYYKINSPIVLKTKEEILKRIPPLKQQNIYALATEIAKYLSEKIKYKIDYYYDPADFILKNMIGSCSEYTFSFIALARSFGLPSRYSGGTAFRFEEARGRTYRDWRFHRLPEVYSPRLGWVPLDPTRMERLETLTKIEKFKRMLAKAKSKKDSQALNKKINRLTKKLDLKFKENVGQLKDFLVFFSAPDGEESPLGWEYILAKTKYKYRDPKTLKLKRINSDVDLKYHIDWQLSP